MLVTEICTICKWIVNCCRCPCVLICKILELCCSIIKKLSKTVIWTDSHPKSNLERKEYPWEKLYPKKIKKLIQNINILNIKSVTLYISGFIQKIISFPKTMLGTNLPTTTKSRPSGLININNSCYMNSLAQALASSPKMVEEFLGLKNQFNNSKINILLDLLEKLNDSRSTSHENTEILKSLIKEIKWTKPEQQDAFDFLSFIINSIHQEIRKYQNDIKIPLKIKLIHKYIGTNTEDKLQDHLGLSVGLCGNYARYPGVSLTSLIDEHFSSTKIDDDENKLTQMMMYGNPPDVLLLHIQANKWDHQQGRMVKPVYHIIYDVDMTLELAIERDSVARSSPIENVTYKLMAIVHHMGTVTGGHYVTYRRLGGRWYLVNDEQVQEIQQFQCDVCPYLLIYEKEVSAIIQM